MKITIEDYNPDWVNDFLEQKERIAAVLVDLNPLIEHIGSTSVVGLCAKPTIDMMIGLHAEEQLDASISPMVSQGFTYFKIYEPSMPYRRLFSGLKPISDKLPPEIIGLNEEFVRDKEFIVMSNVHIIVKDTPHWHKHIAFRDFLRTNPEIRDEYCRVKKEVSRFEYKDTIEYNHAKSDFIKDTEMKALAWYDSLRAKPAA